MKTLVSLLFCLLASHTYSQEFDPVEDSALIEISLTNFQNIPIKKAGLFLTLKHNNRTISIETNDEGKVSLLLPEGISFLIKLVMGDESYEYDQAFTIPKEEGAYMYEYRLRYEMRTFVLENVEFDFNKATIRPSSFPELNQIVEMMKSFPDVVIEISGHTDNVGNDDYNQKLSEKRAKSVKNYIVNKGITAIRLKTIGYGEAKPIADDDTDEGRQKNRRIEVSILED